MAHAQSASQSASAWPQMNLPPAAAASHVTYSDAHREARWLAACKITEAAQHSAAASGTASEEQDSSQDSALYSALRTCSNDDKLRLYSTYKCATEGRGPGTGPEGSRPSVWSVVARAKWDAWSNAWESRYSPNSPSSCPNPDQFKEQYVKLIEEITGNEIVVPKPRPVPITSDDSNNVEEKKDSPPASPSLPHTTTSRSTTHITPPATPTPLPLTSDPKNPTVPQKVQIPKSKPPLPSFAVHPRKPLSTSLPHLLQFLNPPLPPPPTPPAWK